MKTFKNILLTAAAVAVISLGIFAVSNCDNNAYAGGGGSDYNVPTKPGAGGTQQPYNPQGVNGGQYMTNNPDKYKTSK